MATIHDILTSVVGKQYVIAADADSAGPYHDLFGGIADNNDGFDWIVLPGNVDELQAVVRAADDYNHSLWSMPNAAGNGAVLGPAGKPAVIVDQRRMNRIIEVNSHSAYALVEPGVSYRQLYDYLRDQDISLWIDSDRNPDHSIAGSICSRHFGYTPYGDHMLMQCGMEVVLGNGDRLRTGMGAVPGSDTWQLFKYNFGPYLDGLFTQSDMALVSKIGLWLMPQPPAYEPFMITLPDDDALAAFLEALRPLKMNGTIPNTVAVAGRGFEAALEHGLDSLAGDGFQDPVALRTLTDLGEWNVFGALYGGPDNVRLTWEHIAGVFQRIDGALVFRDKDRPDDAIWQRRRDLMGGRPAQPGGLAMDPAAGVHLTAAGLIEADAARAMHDIVAAVAADHGVQQLSEFAVPSRTLLLQVWLPYGEDRGKTIAAAREMMRKLTGAGYGLINEGLALRRIADAYYQGTALDNLVSRLHKAITA